MILFVAVSAVSFAQATEVVAELDTVITYPENGETFTLGRYDELSIWFNTYLSGKLNEENTDPVMIYDAEGGGKELVGIKFKVVSGVDKGFAYQMVKEDGSSLFADLGSYTIEIPAGKFTVTDSAYVTQPSKMIRVSYTVAPVLDKAVIADPADGSKVDTLDVLVLNFQGYGYVGLDGMVNFASDPMNIVINKDGAFYKNFTGMNFGEYSLDDSGIDAIVTLKKLGLKEPGTYTLEFPEGKFNDFMLENPSQAFKLTYIVTGSTGISGVVASEVTKTEYFGLSGVAQDAPVRGVNIKKQTLTDGKVVTSKVYVK